MSKLTGSAEVIQRIRNSPDGQVPVSQEEWTMLQSVFPNPRPEPTEGYIFGKTVTVEG